ncbi:MAG: radical SAM protein [Proteobacteria bacterium]|nr:radical SAM protein [Pseudomonadota bacterium]
MASGKTGKIVIVTFSGGLFNFSTNSMAAWLRQGGHDVSVIQWVPPDDSGIADLEDLSFAAMTREQLEMLGEACKDADVVGISILTIHYLEKAQAINDYVKETFGIPVIWGGVPVIADPEGYLKFADIVCVGEGEVTIEQFLNHRLEGTPMEDVQGVAYWQDGKIKRTKPVPVIDVNLIPMQLVDLDKHYFLGGQLRAASSVREAVSQEIAAKGYRIFAIRGCPFKCTFCVNDKLHDVFHGQSILRKMSVDKIMDELTAAKAKFPEMRKVLFYEDDFFARNDKEFREFIQRYKQEIDLPIDYNATVKLTSEAKIAIMKEAGIVVSEQKLGLQTGSERSNREVYGRPFDNAEFIKKMRLLAENRIPAQVDVISDNPFETLQDKVDILHLYRTFSEAMAAIPDRWRLFAFMDHKLMFYPGTSLYDRALAAGVIDDNYLQNVLLKRRTVRRHTDIDLDRVMLGIFKMSLRYPMLTKVMRLLENRPALTVLGSRPALWLASVASRLMRSRRIFHREAGAYLYSRSAVAGGGAAE